MSSCEIDPKRKKKERLKLIEQVVEDSTKSLKKELDSLCIQLEQNRFEELVDSIKEVRINEIRRKMEHYQKK